MIRTLASLALAQGGWLAIAALAAADRPGYAALVAVPAWFGVVAIARARLRTALLALIAAALGQLADAALVRAGLLDVRGAVAWGVLMPFWWWGLWGLSAASLPTSFGWLRRRPLLAALVGAPGGALAYAAGAGLGAVMLHAERMRSLAAIGVLWAVLLPLLVLLAERLGAFASAEARD